jgi:hypothetical protein
MACSTFLSARSKRTDNVMVLGASAGFAFFAFATRFPQNSYLIVIFKTSRVRSNSAYIIV